MKNLLSTVLVGLLLISCQTNTKKTTEVTLSQKETAEDISLLNELNSDSKSGILEFKISEKQDISFAGVPRMVYRIILNVNSLPKEDEMRSTANNIWGNGNKNWKEFTVFIYLPEMNTGSSAYGIAEFNENGLVKFDKNEYALSGTRWETKKIEEPIKATSVAKLREYKIDISASNAGERIVRININSNFPDGTNLRLYVNRSFYRKGESKEYIGELFDQDFSVKNGKFETTTTINDTEWYNDRQGLSESMPNDFPPISKIAEDININVMYTAATPQPAYVLDVLGAKGEFVTGNGVEHFGTGTAGRLTTLSASKKLKIPFKK